MVEHGSQYQALAEDFGQTTSVCQGPLLAFHSVQGRQRVNLHNNGSSC